MNAAMIIAQFAIQYGIPAAQALVALFNKPSPTAEDWNTVFALVKPYESYVPAKLDFKP